MYRPTRQSAALIFTLVTTVPICAIFCQGVTPSRYSVVNLPFWERRVPTPAPTKISYRLVPMGYGALEDHQPAPLQSLLSTDEDTLLADVETSTGSHASSGRVGSWLTAASALPSEDIRLTTKRDRVAIRLLSAQDLDGNLAPMPLISKKTKLPTYTALNMSLIAQSKNLNGLMAYYERTHSPAAIYAAMHAGEALLSHCAEYPKLISPETAGQSVLPMTRLYVATGEQRFLHLAEQEASDGSHIGLGLCTLYKATGNGKYLTLAEQEWDKERLAHHNEAPEYTAELLKLTGDARYAAALQAAPSRSVWLDTVLYTRVPDGIAVNALSSSHAQLGKIGLSQIVSPDKSQTTLLVTTSHTKRWTLHLFLPDALHHQIVINGLVQRTPVKPNTYVTMTRWWKSGDQIVIKSAFAKSSAARA